MRMIDRFWRWYERNYTLNLAMAAALFGLQAFHLYWLGSHVLGQIVLERGFFVFPVQFEWVYALVDYTEIPALLSVSLIYINELRKGGKRVKSWLYLIFLNLQWVHLFWITDEVVLQAFTGASVIDFPKGLALLAILVDYLEVPVMIETMGKAFKALALSTRDA